MLRLSDLKNGLAYTSNDRKTGALNALKHISAPVSLGDALPTDGKARLDDAFRMGGVRLSISLPTDKNIRNMPVGNNFFIKSVMRDIRAALAAKADATKVRVRVQNGFSGLAFKQAHNVIPGAKFGIRGGISGVKIGKREGAPGYRETVGPTISVLENRKDVARRSVPFAPKENMPISIDARESITNPRVAAHVNANPNNTRDDGMRFIYLVAAVFVAVMVVRNVK